MIHSVLALTTAATDLALLTAAELRAAAGLDADDKSQDGELEALGLEAAEWIAELCGVAGVSGSTPTLLREVMRETFRIAGQQPTELVLARRFVSGVTVTENDEALVADTDFLVAGEAGLLTRLSSDDVAKWPTGKIVVAYTAGVAAAASTVPKVVKGVASDRVRLWLSRRGERDPLLRSETSDDLGSMSYRDAAAGEADFVNEARRRLGHYINPVIG